jgi:hypothetical protein
MAILTTPKNIVIALIAFLTICSCGVVNTGATTVPVPKIEEPVNALGGKKPISDWFHPQPYPGEFDVDKNNTIDVMENYTYAKAVRVIFMRSNFITEADVDKNGFVDDREWAVTLARKRINKEWDAVFDVNKDGVMSVEEEIQGLSHIKGIRDYYDNVVSVTAKFWIQTFNWELAMSYDKDKNYNLSDEEIGDYLTAEKKNFMISYDWNADGKIEGPEQATASQVIQQVFEELNDYLLAVKVDKYKDFL